MEPHYKEKIQRLLYSRTDEILVRLRLLGELWREARFEYALDVGPGPGEITRCLAARTRWLSLVEINSDYEATLRARFPDAELFIGSILDFDVHRHAWDQILLSHVLYYLDESQWLPVCTRLHSALSPQGALVVIINADRGDCWLLLERFRGVLGERMGFSLLRSSEFYQILGSLGAVALHPYTYHVTHDSIRDATEFIGRQVLEIHDDSILEQHRSEFEQAARERCQGDRVVFTFEADLMVVHARNTVMPTSSSPENRAPGRREADR